MSRLETVLKESSSDLRGDLNLPMRAIVTPFLPIPLIATDVICRSVIKLESLMTMQLAKRSTRNLTLSVSVTKKLVPRILSC